MGARLVFIAALGAAVVQVSLAAPARAEGDAPAPSGGAVQAVRELAATGGAAEEDVGSAGVADAWAKALREAQAKPGAVDASASTAAASGAGGGSGGLGLALGALVVASCAGAAGYLAGRRRPEEARPPERFTPPTEASTPPLAPPALPGVRVVATQAIGEHGDLLVVEFEREHLLLVVGKGREGAALVARLGVDASEPPGGWQLDILAERAVAALRIPSPARAIEEAAALVPREVRAAEAPRSPGEDEDLELLLDDLLGKVRGLKPLTRQSDEA